MNYLSLQTVHAAIFDFDGRHLHLMRVDRVMALVNKYYKFDLESRQAQGKLRKTVQRVRRRVYMRLHRMDENRLQVLIAMRDIEKRKKQSPDFAKDYDKGYEQFKIGVSLK